MAVPSRPGGSDGPGRPGPWLLASLLGSVLVLAWPWITDGQRFLGPLAGFVWLLLAAGWSIGAAITLRASPGWRHTLIGLAAMGGALVMGGLIVLQRDGMGMDGGSPRHDAPCRETPLAAGAREWSAEGNEERGVTGVLRASRSRLGLVVLPSWPSGPRGLAVDTLARWWAPRAQVLVLAPAGSPGVPGIQGPDGLDARSVGAAAAWLRGHGATHVVGLAEGDAALAMARAALLPGALDAVVLAGPAGRWGEARPDDVWWRGHATLPGRLAWAVVTGWRLAAPGQGDGETLASLVPRIAPLPLLLLGGSGDRDPALLEAYGLAGEPRSLRWLPGKGRPVPWDGYEAYHQTVMDWLALSFPAATPSRPVGAILPDAGGSAVTQAALPARVPPGVRPPVLPKAAEERDGAPERLPRAAMDLSRLFDDPQPILPPMATHPPGAPPLRHALPPASAVQAAPLPDRPYAARARQAIPPPPRVPFRWPTLEPIALPRARAPVPPKPEATAIIEWDERRQEGTATGSFSR
ncbi:MAG: hypothetical protein FJY99_01910 [Candidatus Sericytochromatia bacterium]|nr:hypothetical protein [Candidatus Tanganyikabacteria bacterium]